MAHNELLGSKRNMAVSMYVVKTVSLCYFIQKEIILDEIKDGKIFQHDSTTA